MYLYHKLFIQCIHQLRFVFSHSIPANEERSLQTHVTTTQLSAENFCLIKSGCETLQCEVKRDKSNTRRF